MKIASEAELCEALGIPFSDEQLKAITAPLSPNVIIAGAGTGKTTVMAARVVWLVATGQVAPGEVLGLTFTRKATAELSDRISASLKNAGFENSAEAEASNEPFIATYDSFAAWLVREFGFHAGIDSDLRLLTRGQSFLIASEIVNDSSCDFEHLKRLNPSTIIERLINLSENVESNLLSYSEIREFSEEFIKELDQEPLNRQKKVFAHIRDAKATALERLELLRLAEKYQELKSNRRLTEFYDQMATAAKMVEEAPVIGKRLRDTFKVVLLDEYQDTSSAQAKLLTGLFVDPQHGGHAVTAVGDPYQAIYEWRGASPSNILKFPQDFCVAGKPASIYTLQVNRRSKPDILKVANAYAQPLRGENLPQAFDEENNQISIYLTPPDVSGESLSKSDPRVMGVVEAHSFVSWPEEASWVVEQIMDCYESGEVASWSDIAILLRDNSSVAQIFKNLDQAQIPTELVGLNGLLVLPGISDLVDMLRLLNDVTDDPAAARLLTGLRWRLGPADLAELGRRKKELCLLDRVVELSESSGDKISSEGLERLRNFLGVFNYLLRYKDEHVVDLVGRVINKMGLSSEARLSKAQSLQLRKLTDEINSFALNDQKSNLSGLVAWLNSEIENGDGLEQAAVSEEDSVKLLTMHKAKGLEWDVVFIPRLVDGTFPSSRVTDNWVKNPVEIPGPLRRDAEWIPQLNGLSREELGEFADELKQKTMYSEDRLAYVAASRAKNRLVLTCSQWNGGKSPKQPSEYFEKVITSFEDRQPIAGKMSIAELTEEDPLSSNQGSSAWPPPLDDSEALEQQEVALAVSEWEDDQTIQLNFDEQKIADSWSDSVKMLLEEALENRKGAMPKVMPKSISASQSILYEKDPEKFWADITRPMPRKVNKMSSVGTRFHEWLEKRFGLSKPLDEDYEDFVVSEDDFPEQRFQKLLHDFENGPYADRVPVAIEAGFVLVKKNGQQIRGRIDAVFPSEEPDFDYQVVDWKTFDSPGEPMQLSLYRAAWSDMTGVPEGRIDAVFYHVASKKIERPQLPEIN